MIALFALTMAFQQTEAMRVRPSTEAQAIAEFEATCVAGLYNVDTLRQAAAASTRGYTLEDGGARGWRNWTSAFGSIHFMEGVPETSDFVPKCNFVSYTRAAVDRDTLDDGLRAMAKRHAVRGFRERREERGLVWSWFDSAGHPMTVEVFLDPRTPQQLILMLKPIASAPR